MTGRDYDLVVIGGGSGGVAASRRAALHGARVAVIEAGRVGGTCVLRGCVPKKLLVYAARVRGLVEDATGFGWSLEGSVDWAALQRAKTAELARLERVYEQLLTDGGVTLVRGFARVMGPHSVDVGGAAIACGTILLACGGAAMRLSVPGSEHAIVSDDALELSSIPPRVAILGSGYIAVEFASIFAGAGARVTLILRRDMVLRGFDDDIRAALMVELRARGIEIRTGASALELVREPGGVRVRLGGGDEVVADTVLAAVGRAPATAGLGLREVGVELDPLGAVVVDAHSRSSVPSIFAIGDCTARPALTPMAIADGRAFADTVFGGRPRTIDHEWPPTAVFSIPPVATIGLPEHVARARGHRIDVYRTRFRPLEHTLSGRDTRSVFKLVVDRDTDRVLGVHMLGVDTPEILQGMAVAMRCGVTKATLDETLPIHPTSAEELVLLRTKVGG